MMISQNGIPTLVGVYCSTYLLDSHVCRALFVLMFQYMTIKKSLIRYISYEGVQENC